MKKEQIELTQNWLKKAKNDLISARKLSSGEDITLDTAIYHCQQAVEKCLKGYLYYYNIDFPKTHDIRVLVSLSMQNDEEFSILQEGAELLTPMAIEYRYPDDIFEPDYSEFLEAYKVSNEIHLFVLNKLHVGKNNVFNP